jgi:hypothetical protein
MSEHIPEPTCKRLFSLYKIFSKILVTDFYTYPEHTPLRPQQPPPLPPLTPIELRGLQAPASEDLINPDAAYTNN